MTKSDCIHIGEYQDMGARMCVCDLVAPLIQEPRCDSCAFYTKTPMLSYEQILDYCKEHDLTLIPKDTLRKLQVESIKHGRWIDVEPTLFRDRFATCSVCGVRQLLDKDNFCPNCGARMDGGENG